MTIWDYDWIFMCDAIYVVIILIGLVYNVLEAKWEDYVRNLLFSFWFLDRVSIICDTCSLKVWIFIRPNLLRFRFRFSKFDSFSSWFFLNFKHSCLDTQCKSLSVEMLWFTLFGFNFGSIFVYKVFFQNS